MEVLRCLERHVLCPWDRLSFYEQDPGSGNWHLIVKPQWMESLVSNDSSSTMVRISSGKKSKYSSTKLQCLRCKSKVGVETPVGPNEERLFCFDYKSVKIDDSHPPLKWKLGRLRFSSIETWTGERSLLNCVYDESPLVAPKRADFEQLDIMTFTSTTPRNYQIELFVRAALNNSLICLPTGTGKTLVAVMVVRLLKQLNEGKVAIFLAHRIPLVNQQALVLEEKGNLRVKVVTGENSQDMTTSSKVDSICSEYQVLALTAQVFLNLVNWGFPLQRCCCIVFDEAHNAVGDHPYAKIMRQVRLSSFEVRPRILGLTASPAGEATYQATSTNVDDLCETFCSARVLMPVLWEDELHTSLFEAKTEYSYVRFAPAEIRLQDDLWDYFDFQWVKFQAGLTEEARDRSSGLQKNRQQHQQRGWTSSFRRELEDISSRFCNSEQEGCDSRVLIDRMLEILLLIDESTVHGVSSVKTQLMSRGWRSEEVRECLLLEKLHTVRSNCEESSETSYSSRVEALLKQIRLAIQDNPSSRILVFVDTRYRARALEYVLENVPDIGKLRPSRLVGHSGFDGMTWEEEQKPMLQRFRSGIVQLLITTTVLEEGIDVPSCNLVVRFDGMGSLTGTVQSRGRARQRDSKFVVILTEEEIEKAQKVRRMEACMQEVVRRKFSQLSVAETTIVNHLVEKKRSSSSSSNSTQNNIMEGNQDTEEQLSELSFVVKLKFHTRSLTEHILRATLRKYANIVKCDMRFALLYLGSFPGQDAASTYRTICIEAIPELIEKSGGEHIWFQRCSTEIFTPVDGDLTGSRKLQLLGVFAGMFKDPSTFVQVYSTEEVGNHHHPQGNFSQQPFISWDSQEEFLCLHVPKEAIIIEFTLAAIDGWVLFHHAAIGNTSHRLYIPLRQAPQVYSASGNQRLASDVDDDNEPRKSSLLNLMRDCLVYELLITPRGRQEESLFTDLVECFERHGVSIYDTKVEDIFTPDNSNTLLQENSSVQSVERDSSPSLDGLTTLSIRETNTEDSTPEQLLHVRNSSNFCTSFLLECIFSQYGNKFPRLLVSEEFYEILSNHEAEVQGFILQAIMKSITWFCDPLALLQQVIEEVVPSVRATQLVPTNYASVREATVTPSRIICYEPLNMKSSRLLRYFDPEHFLKVSFRDENLGFIAGNETKLLIHIRGILKQGVRVAGRLFKFLGCSSSMIRTHSCWMTSLNPGEIRSWLGDFHGIRCVGKYMARVGLGMAASDETITLEDGVVDEPIPDVLQGTFCFSDGVGKISSFSLKEVLKYLHPKESQWVDKITAIQIRVAGYKGVVALDPTLSSEEKQCQLRKSMLKFPSTHRQLEVLNTASSHPVHLNRQSIVLLSCLGVEDWKFERLYEQQLQELLKIFAKDQSEKAITKNCPALKLHSLIQVGIDIPNEPFLQHILSAIYFQKVQRLVTKTHIFVPDGRLLMGVLDETNSLNYGEVFVQICEESTHWKPQIINGKCVTYKNPCFHPGDVRVLLARDVAQLRHLVNCVVFPAKGPRPHTDEMSGGDLDGDLYTVIWMPDLIPARVWEPMSYDPGPLLEVADVVTESDMLDFFVKTIKTYELSQIANSHMALADSRDLGAVDEDCIELAHLHSRAVDFPKTGQQVHVRKDLIPSKYPDFMERQNKASYPSQKLLGRLYRRAKCLFGDDLKRHVNVRLKPDNSLLYGGQSDCSDEVMEMYKQYCISLRGLMHCYGVKQEAEIVTGCIVTMHDHLSSDIFQWTEVITQQFKELVQTFRNRFFASVSSPEERYKLASAWYLAAYTDDVEETRCLSFPWVVSDVLAVIKHNKLDQGVFLMGAIQGQSLEESVYHSMRADFKEKHYVKYASLLDRQDLLEKVETCVRAVSKNATVKMFGSSSTYLFEPNVSDVDLCVKIENLSAHEASAFRTSSEAQLKLLEEILPNLQQDFPGTYAIRDARVPILKYDSGSVAFDLTSNDGGLRKSEIILKYISRYPNLVLVLTAVVKWARNAGLITYQSRGQFTAFSIAWLMIQFCLEQRYVQSIRSDENPVDTRSSALLTSVIEEVLEAGPITQNGFAGYGLPSEVLLHFFRHYANLSVSRLAGAISEDPLRIPDPLGESRYSCVELDPNSYTLFRNKCLQASHALTRTRNVKSLYVLGYRHTCFRLSRFQSAVMRGAEEFHAKKLSSLTGGKAMVRIFSHGKRSEANDQSRCRVLYVDIQGDPAAVNIVEMQLQELNSGHCWFPWSRQAFFVKGATFLLFQGSLSDQDRVGFFPYSGPRHLKHGHCRLHVPAIIARVGGSTWMTHALSRLKAVAWRQRQYFMISDANTSEPSTSTIQAVIRFGTLYVTNVPFDLRERSIRSISIEELEEYIVRGKKVMRPEKTSTGEVQTRSAPREATTYLDEHADATDTDYLNDSKSNHRVRPNPGQRRTAKQLQASASHSLVPHVNGSLERLRTMLRVDGFKLEDRDAGKYLLTLFTPKESQVRLNADLQFVSLSEKPVRWICGSLVFKEDSQQQQRQQQQVPNCVRFDVRTLQQVIKTSELLENLKRNAVLEFTTDHGQGIRVRSRFRDRVGFVRKVKKEKWISRRAGLTVEIMDVTEWEGWSHTTNSFKLKKSRQEVEVNMHDADEYFRGSDAAFDQFIGRFWESALKFKEAIF